MVSSARTMRSWERSTEFALDAALEVALGPFAATRAEFPAGVGGPLPGGLLLGFLGMSEVPENAALSGLTPRRKMAKSTVWRRCNWDGGRYSPREFDRTGRPQGLTASRRFHEDRPNVHYPCVCPGCGRRRHQQHVDVAAAVRPDLRDHVLPDSAPAAEEGEGPCRAREEHSPWRHGCDLRRPGRQGHQGCR